MVLKVNYWQFIAFSDRSFVKCHRASHVGRPAKSWPLYLTLCLPLGLQCPTATAVLEQRRKNSSLSFDPARFSPSVSPDGQDKVRTSWCFIFHFERPCHMGWSREPSQNVRDGCACASLTGMRTEEDELGGHSCNFLQALNASVF